ncbi:MAG TPA: hypothetical protein V6C46_06375 [Coleofasciculaceae cyanobacterium]
MQAGQRLDQRGQSLDELIGLQHPLNPIDGFSLRDILPTLTLTGRARASQDRS